MERAAVEVAPARSRRQRKRELRDSIALAADPRRTGRSASAVRAGRVKVRRVDLWSVFKVSVCFYLTALVVALVAGILLWVVVDALGYVHNVEKFIGDLLSSKDYRLVSSEVLAGFVLVGLALVALATVVTVIAAAFYNLFSELIGGIEVTVDGDAPPGW